VYTLHIILHSSVKDPERDPLSPYLFGSTRDADKVAKNPHADKVAKNPLKSFI